MTGCEDFIENLSLLLDSGAESELTPAEASRRPALQAHAADCDHCRCLLETTATSLRLVRDERVFAMPAGASQRLHAVLQSRIDAGPRLAPAADAPSRSAWLTWLHPARLGWRGLSLAALVVLLAGVGLYWGQAHRVQVYTGYLIDAHCDPVVKPQPQDAPAPRLLHCRKGGYGLLTAKGKYLRLDPKGARKAYRVIAAARRKDHVFVRIRARRQGQTLIVESLQTAPLAPPIGRLRLAKQRQIAV